jgi:RNA polymerase sigma factor (sigma-70 family)
MMASLSAARAIFARHEQWALSIAGAALRRIGPLADAEELQQVAQVTTWERALVFDPKRWTVKPNGEPFQIFAYPTVYGACLMSGYRGQAGRARTSEGGFIQFTSIGRPGPKGRGSLGRRLSWNVPLAEDYEPTSRSNQIDVEEDIDGHHRRRLILAILEELPKRERYLVSEHYLGGVSLSAIAVSLHTSPASVSRIHASALGMLRNAAARRGVKAGEWL